MLFGTCDDFVNMYGLDVYLEKPQITANGYKAYVCTKRCAN